ncbi:MAG: DUF2058 family protein [Planctomycetota bacterium]
MGSLFDELKKAELIDKKRAKQLAHEKRVDKKMAGGDVAEDEELSRKREQFAERRKEERRQHRRTEKERLRHEREKAEWAEIKQLARSKEIESDGKLRWHFETQKGALPYLPVSQPTARRLEAGEIGIVASPDSTWPKFVLVPRDVALAMKRLRPELVRFLNGA